MGLGDVYQEYAFLIKHGYATSGIAIEKGQVVKESSGAMVIAHSWDRGGFGVALDDIEILDTDRKFRVLVDGVVEIAVVHGTPVYFLDRLSIANGGTGQKATPTYEDQYLGMALNYDVLTASGTVPVKLKGW
jgi:hypothetical protein